jgi:hypothetical protein
VQIKGECNFRLINKGEQMKKQAQVLTKAGQDYAKAYTLHYVNKNLKEAFELYRGVIAAYPESQEAIYSREQNGRQRTER